MSESKTQADIDESAEFARAESWPDELENANPDDVVVNNPVDLRRIGAAEEAIDAARDELAAAVAAAPENGRSWGAIGMVLGVSRQAVRERFGVPHQRTEAPDEVVALAQSRSTERGGGSPDRRRRNGRRARRALHQQGGLSPARARQGRHRPERPGLRSDQPAQHA